MKQDFILGKLAEIMGWGEDEDRTEFEWLRLMSQMKYDGYHDFLAGARFIESLADWLQQFTPGERRLAYSLVRSELVYISTAEMNHLVELFYPETVVKLLQAKIADTLQMPRWMTWATPESRLQFDRLRRKTLFIELSDGAKIDVFRRANAGLISNEQVVTAPRLNDEKWNELLDELRKDTADANACFAFVFLIDDFVGSCTTLLREKDGVWKGKLSKFWDDCHDRIDTHFEPGWQLCVHHYLATAFAQRRATQLHQVARDSRGTDNWFRDVHFSYGLILPEHLPLNSGSQSPFIELTEKYYDPSIETKSIKEGGTDARLGFSHCALPLILEHNTPNNSVALLWAETEGHDGAPAMRPLFRRRQRHN